MEPTISRGHITGHAAAAWILYCFVGWKTSTSCWDAHTVGCIEAWEGCCIFTPSVVCCVQLLYSTSLFEKNETYPGWWLQPLRKILSPNQSSQLRKIDMFKNTSYISVTINFRLIIPGRDGTLPTKSRFETTPSL